MTHISFSFFLSIRIVVCFSSQTVELLKPRFAYSFTWHSCLKRILPKFCIFLLIFECTNGSINSKNQVSLGIRLKGIAWANFAFPLEFNDGVLQATSFKSNDRRATNKEFMLHNTTWFKKRRHKSKVSSPVDTGSIGKEIAWGWPKACVITLIQIPHSVCARCRIWIPHVSWSSDQKLHLMVVFFNNVLRNVQY